MQTVDQFAALRPRPVPVALNDSAQAWLDDLPPGARPVLLADQFPRILNRVAATWQDFGACELYLRSLLTEQRQPPRRGFPYPVASEIFRLHRLQTGRVTNLLARSIQALAAVSA